MKEAESIPTLGSKGKEEKPVAPGRRALRQDVRNVYRLCPWGILCFASEKFAEGSKEEHLMGEVKCQRGRSFEGCTSSLQARLKGAPGAVCFTHLVLCTFPCPAYTLTSEPLTCSLHNTLAK